MTETALARSCHDLALDLAEVKAYAQRKAREVATHERAAAAKLRGPA